jgi:hypothetical protein
VPDADGVFLPIDIILVQGAELGDAGGCGIQEIHHGLLAEVFTGIANLLQLQRRKGQTLRFRIFDLALLPDGVPVNDFLVRAPLEKSVQADPDVVKGMILDFPVELVIMKIETDVGRCHLVNRLMDDGEKHGQSPIVSLEGSFRQILDGSGGNVEPDRLRESIIDDQIGTGLFNFVRLGDDIQHMEDFRKKGRIRQNAGKARRIIRAEKIITHDRTPFIFCLQLS